MNKYLKVSYEQIEELVKEQTNNLQERNRMLEAKILDWYAKSKDKKFAEYFGIKEASDGRV
jgi:nitrate/nitrite-specific signal transduction histidine kinase